LHDDQATPREQGPTRGSDPMAKDIWTVVRVAEDAVHDNGATVDGGHDHVPVDGFGDVGGLVAHGVADVLDRDAVAAHDRHPRYLYLILKNAW